MNINLTIAAIISLTILECFALYQGINGQVFTVVIAIIAGLGGYELHKGVVK